MIIENKSAEKKHPHKFLFSKIIKLKIPRPSKSKLTQESHSFQEGGRRQLSLLQKMAINKMINNAQWPIRHRSKDKQARYSKLLKSSHQSIERCATKNEVRMRPIGIKRLTNNYTVKTIECEVTQERNNQQNASKRSESVQYLFNSQFSSARFFSRSVERHKTMMKKESGQSINQTELEFGNKSSLKMLPFIKKVHTFERIIDGKKLKPPNYSQRKLQQLGCQCPRKDNQQEIKGWQGDYSFKEEEQSEYKILAKYSDF